MFRKHLIAAVMLLAFGISALRSAANPVSMTGSAPAIADVVQANSNGYPDSVRGFDVPLPIGIHMLDPRIEVLFDN